MLKLSILQTTLVRWGLFPLIAASFLGCAFLGLTTEQSNAARICELLKKEQRFTVSILNAIEAYHFELNPRLSLQALSERTDIVFVQNWRKIGKYEIRLVQCVVNLNKGAVVSALTETKYKNARPVE